MAETAAGFPDRAEIVIVGGGVIGCSIAYHLAKLGHTDVVLLEQGHLSGGTTWHAAGLVGPLRASESGTKLVEYSAQLYASLEAETGLATGYRNVGGVIVARTPERMTALRRTAANAAAYDMPCEMISPERAQELWPPMQVDDLLGAIWLPGDGKVNPADVTQALAKGARMRGVRILERTRVLGFEVRRSSMGARVTGVRTDHGSIEAEIVVNAAGQWAKALSDPIGVCVPLHSCEHFYVVTESVPGTHPDLPIMRDPDGYTYFKEEVGGLVVGGFEPEAKPWVAPDQIPYPFEFALLEEDWEHFSVLMDSAMHRIPALGETGVRKFYNGPESFTPDNQFIVGEAPEVGGYFVAAGFNSVGIASAGGAGRALAEWIDAREPTSDLVGVDIRRFGEFNGNNRWLHARIPEVLGIHYDIPWPNREFTSARPFRTSPLHDRLAAKSASFGSRMGWERPNYFGPSLEYSWDKPTWLEASSHEQHACRDAVAVFDQTSFSKYVVEGVGAPGYLQWLCAADVDVPIGRCVYTAFLNRRGGYEADLTVTRTGPEEFLLISSSATTTRDLDWLRRHVPAGCEVSIRDVTGGYSVLGVMGPKAPELLSSLSSLAYADLPFAHSAQISLGYSQVRATRMTYVGEEGWELLVPAAFTAGVYDLLHETGADFGLRDAGYYALESLRLEKGYRAFGRELNPDVLPTEAGLVFATKVATDIDFVGRDALVSERIRLQQSGPRRRVVSLVVESSEAMLWGGELLVRDGEPGGQVTSAAWGATVGACVGLGYVRSDEPVTQAWLDAGTYTVDVAGDRWPVRLSLRAPLA